MTEEQQVATMRKVVKILLGLAQRTSPTDFKAMFGASVANVVGVLPEGYWQKMMPCNPCSREGCNCHEIAKAFMDAAAIVRKDHIETMTGRCKGN